MELRKIVAWMLLIALTCSLSACADGRKHQISEEEGDVTEKEKVTIRITWWGGQARHEYMEKLLDYYTEMNPHVEFDTSPVGWDGYFDKMATEAASGAMADLVAMDYLYINTFSGNDSLADLQPYIEDGTIDITDFDEVFVEAGRIDGKLTGIVGSSSILALGYNPAVFEEAGVEVPDQDWTWDDFVDICKTIQSETGKFGVGLILANDTNVFNYYVRQQGYELFSEDNCSLGYDDDSIFIEFVNMHKELIEADAMPEPDEYEAINSLGLEGGPVITGDAGMTQDWHNFTSRMADVNESLQLLSLPASETGEKALWQKPGYFWCISEDSQVKDEAAEFIDWILNSYEAADFIGTERGTPVSSKVRAYMSQSGNLTTKDKEMLQFVDDVADLLTTTPAPDPVGISEINVAFNNAIYNVLYGQCSAEQSAQEFRKNANEILMRNNKK